MTLTKSIFSSLTNFGRFTAIGGRRFTRMRGQTCIYHRTGFNRDSAMSGEDRAIGEWVYVGEHTGGRNPASEQPE